MMAVFYVLASALRYFDRLSNRSMVTEKYGAREVSSDLSGLGSWSPRATVPRRSKHAALADILHEQYTLRYFAHDCISFFAPRIRRHRSL